VYGYSEHLQNLFREAPSHVQNMLKPRYLPNEDSPTTAVGTGFDLISNLRDGVFFAYILDAIKPGSLDLKMIDLVDLETWQQFVATSSVLEDKPVDRETSSIIFRVSNNISYVLNCAKEAGLILVNCGPKDLLVGNVSIMLGLLWQMIRAHLLAEVSLNSRPEVIRLLNRSKGETLTELANLPAEKLLMRWVNHHISDSKLDKTFTHFGQASDGIIYAHLLPKIAPLSVKRQVEALCQQALSVSVSERPSFILEAAELLSSRRFVAAKDILSGNARLNLAFVATLFNNHIGIHLPNEYEVQAMLKSLHEKDQQIAELTKILYDFQLQTTQDLRRARSECTQKTRLLDALVMEKEEVYVELESLKQQQRVWQEEKLAVQGLLAADEKLRQVDITLQTDMTRVLENLLDEKPQSHDTTVLFSRFKVLLKELLEEMDQKSNHIQELTGKLEKTKEINNAIAEKVVEYADAIIEKKVEKKRGWRTLLAWFKGQEPQ
jgi:hypothetical protein